MCCTFGKAELSNTIVYAGEALKDNKLVHVLGYQNTVENLQRGPNAMILPFPTDVVMTEANLLDTKNSKKCLKDISEVIKQSYDDDRLGVSFSKSFKRSIVFDYGIYTIILAESASAIKDSLEKVPKNKRPLINLELIDAYNKWYPNWPIAVCCFDSKDQSESEPLVWWYEPKDKDNLFVPALDSHTGYIPDLKNRVYTDHSVAFGSTISPVGADVTYSDNISESLKNFLPSKVIGKEFKRPMINGDFSLSLNDYRNNNLNIQRVLPPGAK